MKYKAVIFDMDGTILDTLEDLCDSVNYTLRKHGYPERTLEEVRMFVGNGIALLAKRAVPTGTDEVSEAAYLKDLMEYYSAHSAIKTGPYKGINELITKLRKAGYKIAVVSNKPDAAVKKLADEYFPGLFDVAIGEKAGVNKKPAPDEVILALNELGIDNSDAVYVGDSDVDVDTAVNSKMDCIGAAWGFRGRKFLEDYGADVICDMPLDIEAILLN